MSDIIDVTLSDADVEIYCQNGAVFDVLWQDEVNLNLDLNLMYIKSGQAEIQSYVDDVSKPEIDAYLNTQAEPIVADVSLRIVTSLIDDYVAKTSKPELDAFAEAKKPELQVYVASAQEQANLATEQAEVAVAAKNEVSSLAENAQVSASAAEQSSLSAAAAQNNAAASASQAQEFAEQALSASAGNANVDLDNLSSVGAAKFNAKQNTITGAATTIASVNLTANRALISDGSGKVAVSAVSSSELEMIAAFTGLICSFAGDNPPSGWLKCDGAQVSRTTYVKLFSVIGTKYGAGNGSSTFTLPNFINRTFWGGSSSGSYLNGNVPNIIGQFDVPNGRYVGGENYFLPSGAFAFLGSASNVGNTGGGSGEGGKLQFNASRSSGRYTSSNIVRPESLQTIICIKY